MTRASTILLADGDADQLDLMAMMLERAGLRVQTTASNEIPALVDETVAVVVLDAGRARENLEVVRQLRSAGSLVPILLVSALARAEDIEVGLQAGADVYLTKPFRQAEFLDRLQDLLQLG